MSHNTPTMPQKPKKLSVDVLDDLAARFLINLPEEEKSDTVRLFFNLELAHWFYLDFYCTQETANHQPCNIKQFAAHIFSHVPCFQNLVPKIDSILEEWRAYKSSVPTYGTVSINQLFKDVLFMYICIIADSLDPRS